MQLSCLIFKILLYVGGVLVAGRKQKYTTKDVVDHSIPEHPTFLTLADFDANFKEEHLGNILDDETKKQKFNGTDQTLRANQFEGDIKIGKFTGSVKTRKGKQVMRNAVAFKWQLWENREVPYVLSSRYGAYSRRVIARAMKAYADKTCIRFVPRESSVHKDYIYIRPDNGCYSLVGRVGGEQPVSLDEGCIEHGTIIHELMHTAGFFHEQSRTDRDKYIRIVYRNIVNGARDQFEKYSRQEITDLGVKYDYESIMHYGQYAFSTRPYSSNGKTIIALKAGGEKMGQREGFSETDLKKLNLRYECEKVGGGTGGKSGPSTKTKPKKPTRPTRPNKPNRPCRDTNWFCGPKAMVFGCSDPDVARDCARTCNLCDRNGHWDKHARRLTLGSGNHIFKIIISNKVNRLKGRLTGLEEIIPGRGKSSEETPSETCIDRSHYCHLWAKKGFCYHGSAGSMVRGTCMKSCGLCSRKHRSQKPVDSGPIKCEDRAKLCSIWLDHDGDKCDKYPSFMKHRCAKSCEFC